MAEFDDIFNDVKTKHAAVETPAGTARSTTAQAETYSDEELADVNSIITTIPDTTTPIAIFFGPASSGKTMALLRMIRFFKNDMRFTVRAERTFRPSHDTHYRRMCDNLDMMANDQFAPPNTDVISFMLVKVFDGAGRPVLQILEAPGEHYFDEKLPDAPFPAYIEHIIHSIPNRKVWVYFVEQDWKNQTDRNNYADKINRMQMLTARDRTVFLFNKCDCQSHQYDRAGHPRVELFQRAIEQQYPGIFSRHINSGVAKVLFGAYRFKPVCFSAGSFSPTAQGRQRWNVGNSSYCADLWRAMTR